MWVANQSNGEVVKYESAQILASGHPRPSVVITPFPGEAQTAEALAFDSRGRLWISNYYNDTVVMYEPSELQPPGSPEPHARLQLPQLSGPIGLSFDSRDRLWVSEATSNEIDVFAVDTHKARPVVIVSGPEVDMPHSVTFGPAGTVWVPCYNNTVLVFGLKEIDSTPKARPRLILRWPKGRLFVIGACPPSRRALPGRRSASWTSGTWRPERSGRHLCAEGTRI